MAAKVTKRDIITLIIGATVLVVFGMHQFVITPLLNKRTRQEKTIKSKKSVLLDLVLLKAEFERLMLKADFAKKRIAKRKRGFTLFSDMDRMAGVAGIKQNVAYMKPFTAVSKDNKYTISTVEMKLDGLDMEQLVKFLYKVETSPNAITIKRISITKTGKAKDLASAVLQVETIGNKVE